MSLFTLTLMLAHTEQEGHRIIVWSGLFCLVSIRYEIHSDWGFEPWRFSGTGKSSNFLSGQLHRRIWGEGHPVDSLECTTNNVIDGLYLSAAFLGQPDLREVIARAPEQALTDSHYDNCRDVGWSSRRNLRVLSPRSPAWKITFQRSREKNPAKGGRLRIHFWLSLQLRDCPRVGFPTPRN